MAAPPRRQMSRVMAPPPPRVRRSPKFWLYFMLITVTLIAVAFPTLIVIAVGWMPGIVTWFTDRTDQKYGFFCIGGLNLAGVFPYLLDLWWGNHNLTGAMNIITDVFALAVMYGSATAGWFIYTVIPPMITSFMTVLSERRLSALRANQRRIVEEWGDEVTMGLRPAGGDMAMAMRGAPKPGGMNGNGGGGGGGDDDDDGMPPAAAPMAG